MRRLIAYLALVWLTVVFACHLFRKMAASERKYGWRGKWKTTHPRILVQELYRHMEKAEARSFNRYLDFLDVAVYCAFLDYHLRRQQSAVTARQAVD